MNILITGAKGFIGKNLIQFLSEQNKFNIIEFSNDDNLQILNNKLLKANIIVHLAGVNRTEDNSLFEKVNINLTKHICDFLLEKSLKTPIIFSSSIKATEQSPYGVSKYKAEELLKKLNEINNNPIFIYRLPGVFGKWCRPNYNSVVSTFCFNTINNKKLRIDEPEKKITLVYIDDLINDFFQTLENKGKGIFFLKVNPEYQISIKKLAEKIKFFHKTRKSFEIDKVGSGITRKLYSTYISFLSDDFSYPLIENIDKRGRFVEILKTSESGQFSFFTALPGITRGGHYHNTKTEKFIVIHGKAKFKFKHLITGNIKEIIVDESNPEVVDTIPGWIHNIENIGNEELKVLLWSNEIFDKKRPDTYQKNF